MQAIPWSFPSFDNCLRRVKASWEFTVSKSAFTISKIAQVERLEEEFVPWTVFILKGLRISEGNIWDSLRVENRANIY